MTRLPRSSVDLKNERRAKRRLHRLVALFALRAEGKSFNQCATALRVPVATLWRLDRAYRTKGMAGMKTKYANCGRHPLANHSIFSMADRSFVRLHLVKGVGLPSALLRLADSANCSPAARTLINRYRHSRDFPPSFYQYFGGLGLQSAAVPHPARKASRRSRQRVGHTQPLK